LTNLGFKERIILKWIINKQDVRVWTALIWQKVGTSGGLWRQ